MQPRRTMQYWNKLGTTFLLLLVCSVHHTAPATEQMRPKRAGSSTNTSSCPDPGTPRHGLRQPQELSTNFSQGAVVSFGCNSGYRLQGSPELICRYDQATGAATWSTAVPKCIGEPEEIALSLVAIKVFLITVSEDNL